MMPFLVGRVAGAGLRICAVCAGRSVSHRGELGVLLSCDNT